MLPMTIMITKKIETTAKRATILGAEDDCAHDRCRKRITAPIRIRTTEEIMENI